MLGQTPAAGKVIVRPDTTWRFARIDDDVLVFEDDHDRDEPEFGGLVLINKQGEE